MKTKILKHYAKDVEEFKNKGLSNSSIADEINKRHNLKITKEQVYYYLKTLNLNNERLTTEQELTTEQDEPHTKIINITSKEIINKDRTVDEFFKKFETLTTDIKNIKNQNEVIINYLENLKEVPKTMIIDNPIKESRQSIDSSQQSTKKEKSYWNKTWEQLKQLDIDIEKELKDFEDDNKDDIENYEKETKDLKDDNEDDIEDYEKWK